MMIDIVNLMAKLMAKVKGHEPQSYLNLRLSQDQSKWTPTTATKARRTQLQSFKYSLKLK
jgi:hypothetical protein